MKKRERECWEQMARFTDPPFVPEISAVTAQSLWQTALLKVQATMINKSSIVNVTESAKFLVMVPGERP